MKLLKEQIDMMETYYNKFKNALYADNDMEKRKSLGQFYTPPALGSKMLEKYDCSLYEFKDKTILDPTMGSGLLLLFAVIAGADPEKVFGIELDTDVLKLGQKRLCEDGIEVPVVDYSDKDKPKVVYNPDGSVKVVLKKVPKTNLHHGNALNHDCYIFPFSKYETSSKIDKNHPYYKFTPNDNIGQVDLKEPSKSGSITKSGFGFGI